MVVSVLGCKMHRCPHCDFAAGLKAALDHHVLRHRSQEGTHSMMKQRSLIFAPCLSLMRVGLHIHASCPIADYATLQPRNQGLCLDLLFRPPTSQHVIKSNRASNSVQDLHLLSVAHLSRCRSTDEFSNQQRVSVHKTEKLFSCDDCQFRTPHKNTLARHARVHSGEKPYACPECDFCATQKGRLPPRASQSTHSPLFVLES